MEKTEDSFLEKIKNSVKNLWLEHYNYKPLQLVLLSCIAGSTPFFSILLSQSLPESFADDKEIPTTTVIVESQQGSTVTETIEHYTTLSNGAVKTYTEEPTDYSNQEPQDEEPTDTDINKNNTNNNQYYENDTNLEPQEPLNNNKQNYNNTPQQQSPEKTFTRKTPTPTYNNPTPKENTNLTPNNNTPNNSNNIGENNTNNTNNINNNDNTMNNTDNSTGTY